jgi:hypothetical protein
MKLMNYYMTYFNMEENIILTRRVLIEKIQYKLIISLYYGIHPGAFSASKVREIRDLNDFKEILLFMAYRRLMSVDAYYYYLTQNYSYYYLFVNGEWKNCIVTKDQCTILKHHA